MLEVHEPATPNFISGSRFTKFEAWKSLITRTELSDVLTTHPPTAIEILLHLLEVVLLEALGNGLT